MLTHYHHKQLQVTCTEGNPDKGTSINDVRIKGEGVHEIRTLRIRGQYIKFGQGGGKGSKKTPKIRISFVDAP